ncbi:MAG: flagellar hook protein FlgE [Fidelibacterota bacterium]|nr:MAG: flagellar hook protein FlgE [Candidatus Neomarinimicrobiota bacterium]
MLRSLTSAVSGLKNFTVQLDVLGNNLANVRTLGFKSSRVTFADAMSQGLTGRKQVGLGVNLNATDLDFTQGSLEFTGTATDLAIAGNSFFILSDGEKNQYTRAGNFFFDNQGILVNPNGLSILGWRADEEGEVSSAGPLETIFLDKNLTSPAEQTETVFLSGNLDATLAPVEQVLATGIALTLQSDDSPATSTTALNNLNQTGTPLVAGNTISISGTKADGTTVSATFTYSATNNTVGHLMTAINTAFGGQAVTAIGSDGKITLTDVIDKDGKVTGTSVEAGDSLASVTLSSTADISLPAFEVRTEGFTGTATTSTAIYDSLGDSHNLVITFTHMDVDNKWRWEAEFVGDETIVSGSTGTIQFSTSGEVVAFDVDGTATGITIDPENGAAQFTIKLDVEGSEAFSGISQFAGDPSLRIQEQDGRPIGDLLQYEIDEDGMLEGIFSNDETAVLAQVALAEFPNPVGLMRTGDGLYEVSSSSGTPFIGAAGEQFNSSILSGSLEMSNVDLVRQFTDMITTQRGFQASARVVTTSDQVLDETMRLKR